jgi:hypothetical protein
LAERSPGFVPFEEHLGPTCQTGVTTGVASSYSVDLDLRVLVSNV